MNEYIGSERMEKDRKKLREAWMRKRGYTDRKEYRRNRKGGRYTGGGEYRRYTGQGDEIQALHI